MNTKTVLKLSADQMRFVSGACMEMLSKISQYKGDTAQYVAALVLVEMAPKLSSKCMFINSSSTFRLTLTLSQAAALRHFLPSYSNRLGEWEKNEARIMCQEFDQKLI
jgi:hypothetical protein